MSRTFVKTVRMLVDVNGKGIEMKLYCKDKAGNLRAVDTGDGENHSLDSQNYTKQQLSGVGINAESPVLGVVLPPKTAPEKHLEMLEKAENLGKRVAKLLEDCYSTFKSTEEGNRDA